MRVFRSDSLCQRSLELAAFFLASVAIAHAGEMWPRVTLEDKTQSAYLDEDADVLVLTSGHRVPAADSSGRRGVLTDENEVSYPDGSRFFLHPKTGQLHFGNSPRGIDDPLGTVVQPGEHENSERSGMKTEPIFQRLEQLTDPSEH